MSANLFSRISSLFSKKNVADDEIEKQIAETGDHEAVNAYREWKDSSKELLLSTKKMLEKSGLDTSKIDELLTKYHKS